MQITILTENDRWLTPEREREYLTITRACADKAQRFAIDRALAGILTTFELYEKVGAPELVPVGDTPPADMVPVHYAAPLTPSVGFLDYRDWVSVHAYRANIYPKVET